MILLILTEHFTSLAAFAAAAALVLCLVGCGELFEKPDTLRHAALMMTDLDNLKTINDTYGHDWGDIYLRQTAHSLRQGSPSGTVVARLSGDEFLLLFYGYETREALWADIKKLEENFAQSSAALPDGKGLCIRMSGDRACGHRRKGRRGHRRGGTPESRAGRSRALKSKKYRPLYWHCAGTEGDFLSIFTE